jgi:hypothetical protein
MGYYFLGFIVFFVCFNSAMGKKFIFYYHLQKFMQLLNLEIVAIIFEIGILKMSSNLIFFIKK